MKFNRTSLVVLFILYAVTANGQSDSISDFSRWIDEGKSCVEKGYYAKADSFFRQAIAIEKDAGSDNLDYAIALNELGNLYYEMAIYTKAAGYYSKTLEITSKIAQKKGSKKSFLLASAAMSGFSNLLYETKDFKKALSFSENAAKIQKEIAGENATYLSIIDRIIHIHSKIGYEYSFVESEYLNLLQKKEVCLGKRHPDYSQTLVNLAQFYKTQGQDRKSLETYIQAMNLLIKMQSTNTEIYMNVLLGITSIYEKLGNLNNANYYANEADSLIKKKTENNFTFLSNQERELYWMFSASAKLSYIQSFFTRNYTLGTEALSKMYNNELFVKGLLLSSTEVIQQSVINSGNKELISNWSRLVSIKRELIRLESEPIDKQAEKTALEKQAEQVEKIIIQNSQEYRSRKKEIGLHWTDIQKSLDKQEVAIEFLQSTVSNTDSLSDKIYYALVLKSNSHDPEIVKLGSEKVLKTALLDPHKYESLLYGLIWKPLEEKLSGIRHIYLAPSGLLNGVAFSGIKKGDNYLCDEYTIHNLLSTRDIVTIKNRPDKETLNKKAILFGGADFSLSSLDWKPVVHSETSTLTRSEFIPLTNKDSLFRGQGFGYLPGSKEEVERIRKCLTSIGWDAQSFTGNTATETWFKSFSANSDAQSPQLIHLSTHGFYLPPVETKIQQQKPNIYRISQNPLMRTGLAFTGSNDVWSGKPALESADDGILTAYEVSNMNLLNTELVVLSACDTGLGDVYGSEGVYGLQRAFRLAGVQSMIVSLWKVPDKETVELMDEFYTQWSNGISKKDAFTKAQLKMRNLYPENPEKWAGFVMIE